jgi:Putative DNA-binding domain
MPTQNAALDDLLAEPRETLDVEFKEWLDLSDHDHRAIVAKEIIALANHGGGYLVIGFDDGSLTPAAARPATLEAWSQDAIQSIVAKYVDPAVQCEVIHQVRAGSQERHPIAIVPGGHRIPIRAKAGSPDGKKLVPHRVYIRRAGPASEEPRTAEEWDRLFERCLQNRKAEFLEAYRSIMAGEIPTARPQTPSRLAQLLEFEKAAVSRWGARIVGLPTDAPPAFPDGYCDLGIAIDGTFDKPSLSDLRDTIKSAVRNHSGWPPFLTIDRAPFAPKPIEGAVEFWRGPDSNGSYSIPIHHDFWRISPEGMFFTRCGYREDGGFPDVPSGKYFDITSPTWRLGEAILQGGYIASALGASDANLIIHSQWHGLAGRKLMARGNPLRLFLGDFHAAQGTYVSTQTVALSALPGALPEVVFAILAPLYELFDFYKLPKRLVEEELASLQRNRF